MVSYKFALGLGIITSLLISISTLFLYDRFFLEAYDMYTRNKAVAVAESDILFSDRFNKAFNSSQPNDFVTAAELSRKSVVFLRTKGNNDAHFGVNSGSGVILSNDGYIVTNHHVIKDAIKIDVTLNDNREFEARIIGVDPSTDLALLKIDAINLDYLIFGNSDSLLIGEWVMAVGNPFRLQSTVTAGIVSAKARSINLLENQGIESFIQTDAAVNPGNSGGALINTRGDLIGICTAIQSNSGRFEGFSFAIPSNLAKKVIADLREYGVVQRGWLGIDIENIDNQMASKLKLDEVAGVFVASVHKSGGAAAAGITKNDVIISVNNIKTSSVSEFTAQMAQYRPGDKIDMLVIRNEVKVLLKATLLNQLNSTDLIANYDAPILRQIGMELREPDKYEKAVIAPQGVIIVSVQNGKIISTTRVEPGYIITKVDNHKVTSVQMLIRYLEDHKGKSIIFEGFYPKVPGEFPYTFVVPE